MGKKRNPKFICALLGIITLSIGFGLAGTLRVELSGTNVYQSCYQPYHIYADTAGISTDSIDTKFFLENLTFNTNYTDYVTYISGDMDNNPNSYPFATGTSGANMYYYINSRQNIGNSIESGNLWLATLYLKPTVAAGLTGEFIFHFYPWGITTGLNDDDSNISSGYNESLTPGYYTQYYDVLTGTTDGIRTVTGNTYCPEKPYILTSTYYQWTYFTTATGVERIRTGVYAGPNYTFTDAGWNSYLNTTGWTIWTTYGQTKEETNGYNTGVKLTLTGNEGIQMISLQMIDEPNIYAIGYVASGRSDTRQFWITGTIYTGYITFDNYIGNVGDSYLTGGDPYANNFNIDVFRIDTVDPTVLTSTIASGNGYETIYLSGQLSNGASNETVGRHHSGSYMDDQFAIYEFSGINDQGYGYETTTGYSEYLIGQYGGEAGSGRSMEKTLNFTQSREGYVLFVDRAGNTGEIYLDININPTIDATIITKPAFREKAQEYHTLSGLATTGDIRLAYKSSSEWIYTHNSQSGDAKIKTNHNGTGIITMRVPISGAEYLVVFKGSGMLSVGFTGIWTNDILDLGTNLFDFVTWSNNDGDHEALFPSLPYKNSNYIKVGDVSHNSTGEYDLINELDLQAINTNLTIGLNPNIDDIFYYDFDINNVINAIEQAIIIEFDTNYWFIEKYDGFDNIYKTGFVTF